MIKKKKPLVAITSFILLLLFPVADHLIGQVETVSVKAYIQEVLSFESDGTDADNIYESIETINFGNVDSDGTATTGGDFTVTGTPIGDDSGVYYDVFAADGGNDKHSHPNAAYGLHIKSNKLWDLDATAVLAGDSSVTIDQLYWREDPGGSWTPFAASQNIYTNGARGNHWYFHDYRLEVQYSDVPGNYTWTITYTITQK